MGAWVRESEGYSATPTCGLWIPRELENYGVAVKNGKIPEFMVMEVSGIWFKGHGLQ